LQNSLANVETRAKFGCVKGLSQIVIGARFQPQQQIFLLRASGKQQDVDIGAVLALANLPAHLNAFKPRHHPVQHGETRSVDLIEKIQGLGSACGNSDIVSPPVEKYFQQSSGNRVVFGNQNFLFQIFLFFHNAPPLCCQLVTTAVLPRGNPNVAVKCNVLPRAGTLSTQILPPIKSTKRLVIAKPRPVPPYFRVVELSACVNASKIMACLSSAMPIPLS